MTGQQPIGQMPPQANQFQTGAVGGGNPFAFAGGAPGRQENVPSFLQEKQKQQKDEGNVKLDDLMNFKAENFSLGNSNTNQSQQSSQQSNPFGDYSNSGSGSNKYQQN